MITAPYNFVPLNEKVFFPNWADDVSHDIPFEDAQSGVIDITITAKSPIFIRDSRDDKKFCNYKGVPYIPSSSIKGMVRSVLEIMSFSKMSLFDDDTYAVRDLSSANNFYMKEMRDGILCGWLSKSDDGYIIEDCGVPYRISHKEIDRALGVDFASKFKRDDFEKTSKYKYNIVGGTYKKIKVSKPYKSKTNPKYDKRLFCRYDKSGDSGLLVLTGQPTVRKDNGKKGDGKGFEFVFMEKEKYERLSVAQDVFDKFLFAYFDSRDTEPKESADWSFWKKKLKDGERVPVFFKKRGKEVVHFGLSYLYKLPYKHSIAQGIPSIHKEKNRRDLAETIFGYIGDKESLKGRVQFSHFIANGDLGTLEDGEVDVVLGTPRASYYPTYIDQEDKVDELITYMDNHFVISGRKRYPINTKIEKYELPVNKDGKINEKVVTTFTPLKDKTVFTGKLRYHNLKKVEIGAVLSALSFHNTKGCYHNIGMAKPLGYGKIEIKIDGIEIEEYLKEFEYEMSINIPNWAESEQLTELLSMATEQDNRGSSKLRYMDIKQFAKMKSKKFYLKKYTKLDNIKSVSVQSLISKDELERLKELQTQKEEQKRKEDTIQRELDRVLDELQKENINLQVIQNFIDKYPEYKKSAELIVKKEEIEKNIQENKYKEVNTKFDRAYEALQKKRGKQKQYQKEREKFIKKWSKAKENKGSKYIIDTISKL